MRALAFAALTGTAAGQCDWNPVMQSCDGGCTAPGWFCSGGPGYCSCNHGIKDNATKIKEGDPVASASAALVQVHPPTSIPEGWSAAADAVDLAEAVEVAVGLKRSNAARLGAHFWEASDPRHARYGRHLSHAEMGDLVRPPAAARAVVDEWLRGAGAARVWWHPHGDQVRATLTREQTQALVGGRFAAYRTAGREGVVARITTGVWAPAAVAAVIDTVSGFAGFPLFLRSEGVKKAAPAGGAAGPPNAAVTPALINKHYGVPDVEKSGKRNIQAVTQFQGQYVAEEDLDTFCTKYGKDVGANCTIAKFIHTNVPVQPGVESMLDTEYITGLGQGSETWVYSYPSFDFCADLLVWGGDVLAEATFPYSISMSYGSQKIDFCDNKTISRLSEDIQKMGGVGVTVMISSGDDGSGESTRQGSNDGKLSPSFPASIPYCVAVGSTFFVNGTDGEEQATTQFGSGGGFSYDFSRPSYQDDAVKGYLAADTPLPTLKYQAGGRGSPDVSLLGESFAVVVHGSTESVGGTSASSPSVAAMVTLLNEVCLKESGAPLGFVNPLFYQNAAAFTDIVKGTNAIGQNKEGWKAIKGWDAATGLGVPDFAKLVEVVRSSCAARR